MLILFDIDGTLLHSHGAGVGAMVQAGRALFGPAFTADGLSYAGKLDPMIWSELCAMNGIDDPDGHHEAFRGIYGQMLGERFAADPTVELLPGVAELLAALGGMDDLTIGLLTGNYPETGRMKVRAAGLDPVQFKVSAWGCDGASRRELPPVAMRRHVELLGRAVDPGEVVIIGDTPHDVDCARSSGCRSLGVGTGRFSAGELAACGADLALGDLSETASVLRWMLESSPADGQ